MSASRIGGALATGPNGATTAGFDTTGATLLTAKVAHWNNELTGTISDSKGNTWTALTDQASGGGARSRIFYCLNPASVGAAHTCTFTGPGNPAVFAALEFEAWAGGTASFDGENSAGASASTIQPGAVTAVGASNVVITALASIEEAAVSIGSGFTKTSDTPNTGGTHFGFAGAYKLNTSGAQNPTWTTGATDPRAASIAAFTLASVTPPTASFSSSVNGKRVTLTDTSTPGTNPITGFTVDWGDGTVNSSLVHQYVDHGTYTISLTETDGTLTSTPATADVITTTKYRYRGKTILNGRTVATSQPSNIVGRPDA